MSPLTFIRNPELWLDAIQRYGADTTHAPAFAYELVAKRLQASGNRYDLSTLTTADCGGEPITQATLQAMLDAGFPAASRRCGYGMAECLMFVGGSRHAGEANDHGVSSTDLAFSKAMGYNVVVADPETHTVVDEGETGHIYVRSPAVIPGYYRRPEQSSTVFGVELHGVEPSPLSTRGWYDTRDVGFIRHGQLYVSGRSSDVIIVAGRNIFPQDVERAADRLLPQVRPGCTAAFQVTPTSAAVLMEARPGSTVSDDELKATQRALEQEFGLQLAPVLVLSKGSVPKTTSGKVRRKLCKQRYFGGGLPEPLAAAGFVPQFASSRRLASPTSQPPPATFTELLERYGVEDRRKTLVENGVDSLRLALLVRDAQQHFGITIHAADVASVPAVELGASTRDVLAPRSAVPAAWPACTPLGGASTQLSSVQGAPSGNTDTAASSSDIEDQREAHSSSRPTQPRQVSGSTILLQLAACCFVLLVPIACLATPAVVYARLTEWRIATAGRDNSWIVELCQRPEVGLLLMPMTWMLTYTAAVVLLKWLVMWGRYRPGRHTLWSPYFTRWWIVDRLVAVWEAFVGRHLKGTPYLTLVYWAMGCTSLPLSVRLDAFIREVDWFTAGPGAWISGVVMCRVLSPRGMLLAPVHIGRDAHVGGAEVVYPGVTVPSATAAHDTGEPAHVYQRALCPMVVATCCGLGLRVATMLLGESLDGLTLLLSGLVVSGTLMGAGIVGCRFLQLPFLVDRLYETGAWLVSWWVDYSPLAAVPYHLMGARLAWSVHVNRMAGVMLPSSAAGVTVGAHSLLTTAVLRPTPGRPIKIGSCAVVGSRTWVLDDVSVGDGAAVGTLATAVRGTHVPPGSAFIGTRGTDDQGRSVPVLMPGRPVSVHCEPTSWLTIAGSLVVRAVVHWAPAVGCFWAIDGVVAAVNSVLVARCEPALRVPTVSLVAVVLGAVACVLMRSITLLLTMPRPSEEQRRTPGAEVTALALHSMRAACWGANYSHNYIVANVGLVLGGTWVWNAILAAGGTRFSSVFDAFIMDGPVCDGRLISIGQGVVLDHATITGHRLEVGGIQLFTSVVGDGCSQHPGSRVMGGDHLGPGIVLGARSKTFSNHHRVVASECGPHAVLMGVPAAPVTSVMPMASTTLAFGSVSGACSIAT